MNNRKPILYLAIVFALVCLYQLSFTWKVKQIDKDKAAYALSQIDVNKQEDIKSVTQEFIESQIKDEMLEDSTFINKLEQENPGKELVFMQDTSKYFQIKEGIKSPIVNTDVTFVNDSGKIDTISIVEYYDNYKSIKTIEDVPEFEIISLSDSSIFLLDTNLIQTRTQEKKLEIENDYLNNRLKKLKDLEYQHIQQISYSGGSDQNVYNLLIQGYTYQECKDREINLGLDLKGGISATLEVSVKDILINYADNNLELKDQNGNLTAYGNFLKRLESADVTRRNSQEGFIDLFLDEYAGSLDKLDDLSQVFSTRDLNDEMNDLTNGEVIDKLRSKIEGENGIINNTFNTLKERSQRFSNTRPNILKTNIAGRFIVELPGAEDIERAKSILTDPAKLEFWEAYKLDEVFDFPETADGRTIRFKGLADDNVMGEWLNIVNMFNQSGQLIYQPTNSGEFGSRLGRAYGRNKQDLDAIDALFDKMESLLPNINFAYGYAADDKSRNTLEIYALKKQGYTNYDNDETESGEVLSGDIIKSSGANIEGGQWEVTMTMKQDAANKWGDITAKNIDNYVAIVLDDEVKSCPVINTEIRGGRSVISGNFSANESKDLANILGSGQLQSKLDVVQQSVVGPTLGQESIDSGIKSFGIALALVLLYMIFYYKGAGLVSNVALLANIFFIFGVLSSTGLVLTLPGIAGIVLTIGMAVDANILIYERIREEIKNSKGIRLAISDGYKSAYTSIIDANVTTLLTGVILYVFGSGPIKGFATTLIIGIITSLFSAIFITRLIISWRLNKGKSMSFSTKLTDGAFKNLNIDFIGKRKIFYVVSSVLILFGSYSLFTKGLNYGIDFSGGRTYVVHIPENQYTSNEDIQESLSKVFINPDGTEQTPQVTTFSNLLENNDLPAGRTVKITTKYMIDNKGVTADEEVRSKLLLGLGDQVTKDNILSYDQVSSTIADDIRSSAWGSISFSILVIFLYILVRFKKWQFSLGAVAAVFHDVLIVLSVFSIFYGLLPFTLEIDQAFIAAILTIIGYSLNDTVVVFDRVRENMINFKRKEIHEFMNKSLNSTLSRTINTSFTTFCVLLIIFLFGGEVIKGFMFALMIGVIVGTYSSLFVASPIMLDTIRRKSISNNK